MNIFSFKYIRFWFLLVIIVFSLTLFSTELFGEKRARIIFLDVGQGDATLIQTASGRNILIDAGKYKSISENISPYMKSKRLIDLAIATHPDIDHISGFDVLLDEYRIEKFFHSGLNAGSPIYQKIVNKINNKKISNHRIVSGERYFLDKGLYLEVLYPYENLEIEDANDYSAILLLDYYGKKIVLPGDASREVENKLVDIYGEYLDADILKLGHHGSKTSTSDSFVKTVSPEYGIISAACDNSFGHPHASVLRTLDEHKVQKLGTCDYGDIEFVFDNGNWVLLM